MSQEHPGVKEDRREFQASFAISLQQEKTALLGKDSDSPISRAQRSNAHRSGRLT